MQALTQNIYICKWNTLRFKVSHRLEPKDLFRNVYSGKIQSILPIVIIAVTVLFIIDRGPVVKSRS